MPTLDRLHIRNFRGAAPDTVLTFNGGFNVLLGRNGAGKTQLLELISSVVQGDLRQYENEMFDLEWDLTISQILINVRASNDPSKREPAWSYEVQFTDTSTQDLRRYACTHTSEPEITGVKGVPGGRVPLFDDSFVRTVALRLSDIELWIHLDTAYAGTGRFDEGLRVFEALVGQKSEQFPVELVVQRQSGHATFTDWGFFPGAIGQAISDDTGFPEDWEPSFSSKQWPVLDRIATAFGCKELVFEPKLRETQVFSNHRSSYYDHFEIKAIYHDGRVATAPQFSFGQKRLAAFLYYAASSPAVAIADELVNGLHWEWIELCLEAIQYHQSFLTSQNPLLLDAIPIESEEDAARTFIQCLHDPQSSPAQWQWRNLPAESAKELWNARQVGIQGTAEALLSWGLW